MKKTVMSIVALACAALVCSCGGNKGVKVEKGNPAEMDSLSYCMGANVGTSLKYRYGELQFNIEEFKNGLQDGLTNKSNQSYTDVFKTLNTFFTEKVSERYQSYQQKLESDSTAVFNPFDSEEERHEISYAFGLLHSKDVAQMKMPLKYYWLLKGFQDSYEGSTEIPEQDVRGVLQKYFMITRPALAAERSAKWLEKKEKAFGVKKTESGLLYKVVKSGDMEKAAKSDEDVVKVHYVGKLQDGTVFDASLFKNRSKEQQEMMRLQRPAMFDEKGNLLDAEEPIEFPLNRVIKGWTEGMKLVGPGGKIKLYIPAELAYGPRGGGQLIGPNEALEFEVELLEVIPAVVEEAPAAEAEAAPAAEEVKAEPAK